MQTEATFHRENLECRRTQIFDKRLMDTEGASEVCIECFRTSLLDLGQPEVRPGSTSHTARTLRINQSRRKDQSQA